MAKKSIHISMSVRGALLNWRDRDFEGVFKHDDGRPMTAREAKAALLEELSKGHEVIPSEGCDNFDVKKGCLGHTQADTAVGRLAPVCF